MPTRLTVLGLKLPETVFRPIKVLPTAAAMIGLLALLEHRFALQFSLGVLYVFPIVLAATVMTRVQIVLLAAVCAYIRGLFLPQPSPLEEWLRFSMAVLAYAGIGLLIVEMSRNRRRVILHYAGLKMEQELRRKAEEQLQTLVQSSPAAILTVDHDGLIIAANRAAGEMFGLDKDADLIGQPLGLFVSALGNALKLPSGSRQMRTSAWTWARRADGTMFPIATWFSTYGTGSGRHLAAIVVDVSEEIRDRERENFRHLLDSNRLLAGAVSHEIRNMCSAAAVVSSNLGRRRQLHSDADFIALQKLMDGLTRIASFDLRHRSDPHPQHALLGPVLDHLRIIIEPDWQENDGEVRWDIEPDLPEVLTDPHGLLQILLNLCQNSLRAVSNGQTRVLTIQARRDTEEMVRLSVIDSGPGVPSAVELFHAFRADSDGSGLGLYISRTIARSLGGDVVHVPQAEGCRFDITLPVPRKQKDAILPVTTAPPSAQPSADPPVPA